MKNLLIALAILISLPLAIQAHAPKKVTGTYDADKGILKVDIPHKVKNVETHFIEKIVVTINEKETVVSYSKQSSKEKHVVEIELPGLEKGTVVSIYAKCNKLGAKKGTITIE